MIKNCTSRRSFRSLIALVLLVYIVFVLPSLVECYGLMMAVLWYIALWFLALRKNITVRRQLPFTLVLADYFVVLVSFGLPFVLCHMSSVESGAYKARIIKLDKVGLQLHS